MPQLKPKQDLRTLEMRFDSAPLLKRIRDMVTTGSLAPSDRLAKILKVLREDLQADAASLYVIQPGNILELAATSGLNQNAVGVTRLSVDEGIVGFVVTQKKPLSVSNISKHPNFILRPETGEQFIQGGVATVPVMRGTEAIGALSIQSTRKKRFTPAVVDALETIALLIIDLVTTLLDEHKKIEMLPTDLQGSRMLQGIPIHIGLAEGTAIIHADKHDVPLERAKNPAKELIRFERALEIMNRDLSSLVLATQGESTKDDQRSILETFQAFSKDQGWIHKIRLAMGTGLTAESAVQKTLNDIRLRLSDSQDHYMRERLWDFEDLAYRLIDTLKGKKATPALTQDTKGIIVVAKSLGPAELMEYQQHDLRAVLLEEGVQTAHVAILARSLDIPIIGRIPDVTSRIVMHDKILVDGKSGTAIVAPNGLDEDEFAKQKVKQDSVIAASRTVMPLPAVTIDGVRISLHLNAGLITDLDQLKVMDVDGVGLYRTEIPFMMQKKFPDVAYQTSLYRDLYERMDDKPLVFRTLDIGGDKVLPYFNRLQEDNPMLGWRAIRIGLDRPMLLRKQVRAMIRAARGRSLSIMFPMIATVHEFIQAKALVQKELDREVAIGHQTPFQVKYGAMLEVPALIWRLDELMPQVDFLSIGTNDLFQFCFATDRGNPYVADYFDTLSPAFLSILQHIKQKAEAHHCPLSICGEMASRPLEALALLGLGYQSLSMGASAIGPSKMMIRSVNLKILKDFIQSLISLSVPSVRHALVSFAKDNRIKI